MKAKIEQIKHLSYETIHGYLNEDLIDKGLIEITRVDLMTNMKSKFKKYFRLSLNGLLYVIMNCSEDASGDLIQSIVKHYRTNIFFGIFLYPLIKEETLMALTPGWDFKIIADMHTYLQNICQSLDESLKSLKTGPRTTTDGFVVQEIFFWIKDDAEQLPFISILSLKYFLKKTLRWDWIFDASFILNIQEKTIEIINPQNPKDNSLITFNENEKRAVLRQNGKQLFEFRISETDSLISFEIKTSSKRIKFIDSHFVDDVREYLLILLTKLREQSQLNVIFDIFYQDERFKKALERMDLKPITKLDTLLDY
jgi:hypothetical protein